MQPAAFDYYAPRSLGEAATLLAEGDGDARIIAGGQSLVAAMNLRLARPGALIDLRRIPGLDRIDINDTSVRIGARVTHAQIISSAPLRAALPILAQAGHHISHSTIRERGTMAGSLALADPAAEWPSVFLALGGRVHAISTQGERTIDADDFFVSYYTTALAPNEIITAVELPLSIPSERYAFAEFSRQTGAFALALAVAKLTFDSSGKVADIRVAIGGCGARPMLVSLSQLVGTIPSIDSITRAAEAIELTPSGDIHAGADDRRQIAITMVKRSVIDAWRSANSEAR